MNENDKQKQGKKGKIGMKMVEEDRKREREIEKIRGKKEEHET